MKSTICVRPSITHELGAVQICTHSKNFYLYTYMSKDLIFLRPPNSTDRSDLFLTENQKYI